MRVPRARAESGERTVETAAAGGAPQRVLTSLTNSNELGLPAFSSVESLNSGLTRTTPTLTPTTLRNIEETFMAFDRGLVAPPVSHQHQAGFVTPQVAAGGGSFAAAAEPHQLYQHRRTGGASPAPSACDLLLSKSPSPPADTLAQRAVPQGHHRGGRRPKDDDELSPEEEQRRRVRRERNKQAAARCRRRRLDLTNTLQMETEELEDERSSLEREIQMLTAQKEELNFLLEAHRPCCKLGRDKENAPKRRVIVKQEPAKVARTEAPLEPLPSLPPPAPVASLPARVPRPTTLSVAGFATSNNMHKDVPISTPSQGLGLNFDSLMQGGTGLTPISGTALPPLLPLTSGSLATPVVSQPDRRADMLSPETGKELVSL